MHRHRAGGPRLWIEREQLTATRLCQSEPRPALHQPVAVVPVADLGVGRRQQVPDQLIDERQDVCIGCRLVGVERLPFDDKAHLGDDEWAVAIAIPGHELAEPHDHVLDEARVDVVREGQLHPLVRLIRDPHRQVSARAKAGLFLRYLGQEVGVGVPHIHGHLGPVPLLVRCQDRLKIANPQRRGLGDTPGRHDGRRIDPLDEMVHLVVLFGVPRRRHGILRRRVRLVADEPQRPRVGSYQGLER